ncbi:MAG: hypothetical protein ACYDH6_21960 [Acidimicrobiales bacterium]
MRRLGWGAVLGVTLAACGGGGSKSAAPSVAPTTIATPTSGVSTSQAASGATGRRLRVVNLYVGADRSTSPLDAKIADGPTIATQLPYGAATDYVAVGSEPTLSLSVKGASFTTTLATTNTQETVLAINEEDITDNNKLKFDIRLLGEAGTESHTEPPAPAGKALVIASAAGIPLDTFHSALLGEIGKGCLGRIPDQDHEGIGGTADLQYVLDPGHWDLAGFDFVNDSACAMAPIVPVTPLDLTAGSRTYFLIYRVGDRYKSLVLPIP